MRDNNSIQTPDIQNKISFDKLRILLWDIDGTLMRSVRHGEYKKYFAPAMKKVYGSCGKLDSLKVSGMTDTQIMYESLCDEGFTPEQIFAAKENLLKIFKKEMSDFVAVNPDSYIALEGAREILAETNENHRFINSLLTGNLSVAAEIKLKSVGLWHYFENSINAFGEISHERKDLAMEIGKLFNEFYKFDFKPEQFIVIGDTPNDIACARAFGAKSVAVATGKNHPRQDLLKYQPDIIVDDLSDTEKIIEIFQTI